LLDLHAIGAGDAGGRKRESLDDNAIAALVDPNFARWHFGDVVLRNGFWSIAVSYGRGTPNDAERRKPKSTRD
jgi:hypothetical protein